MQRTRATEDYRAVAVADDLSCADVRFTHEPCKMPPATALSSMAPKPRRLAAKNKSLAALDNSPSTLNRYLNKGYDMALRRWPRQ
jgi:hypothetical protein